VSDYEIIINSQLRFPQDFKGFKNGREVEALTMMIPQWTSDPGMVDECHDTHVKTKAAHCDIG
jgi:hypothetical protein